LTWGRDADADADADADGGGCDTHVRVMKRIQPIYFNKDDSSHMYMTPCPPNPLFSRIWVQVHVRYQLAAAAFSRSFLTDGPQGFRPRMRCCAHETFQNSADRQDRGGTHNWKLCPCSRYSHRRRCWLGMHQFSETFSLPRSAFPLPQPRLSRAGECSSDILRFKRIPGDAAARSV
jgi:hypothetical protein